MTKFSDAPSHVEADRSEGSELGLQMLAKACAASGCPTIYQSDRGTLVIQGYAVSAHQAGIELPEGELLVEIPADLLAQLANRSN